MNRAFSHLEDVHVFLGVVALPVPHKSFSLLRAHIPHHTTLAHTHTESVVRTYDVPMLGNFGAMLGQCWTNRCLCWAYAEPFAAYVGPMVGHLVSFMGFHGSFWREKEHPKQKLFVWGSFWGRLKGYVGPMLGPCWVIWWALWGSMEVSGVGVENLQPKTFPLRVFSGHFLLSRDFLEPYSCHI